MGPCVGVRAGITICCVRVFLSYGSVREGIITCRCACGSVIILCVVELRWFLSIRVSSDIPCAPRAPDALKSGLLTQEDKDQILRTNSK